MHFLNPSNPALHDSLFHFFRLLFQARFRQGRDLKGPTPMGFWVVDIPGIEGKDIPGFLERGGRLSEASHGRLFLGEGFVKVGGGMAFG